MIAKAKAIAHGSVAIAYAMNENKKGEMITSNLIEGLTPTAIYEEFKQVNQYNERCKNKFIRIEIGFAPQDESSLTNLDIASICEEFASLMNLENNQWVACTHRNTDHLHVHLIANRIGIDGKVYSTDFISNKAAHVADGIAHKRGLIIANNVYKQKEYRSKNISAARVTAKENLRNIAYRELNKQHSTKALFIQSLEKQNIIVEHLKNKQGKVYGMRFSFEGETFKASEIGKEFGFHSLSKQFRTQHTVSNKQKRSIHQSPIYTSNKSSSLFLGLAAPADDFQALNDAARRKRKKMKL